MSQFAADDLGGAASRQSAGFELLKKFSNATSTLVSFNFQGRLVRRDGFVPVLNDMEGQRRRAWAFEYHNVYLDLYNVLNPLLGADRRSANVGRYNLRVGRFYVPFGLNLQTDTHGTVLQLSNERSFGFERDWYAGFWGRLNRHLNYDVYYLAGSGYDLEFKGQRGLAAVRVSLSNKYAAEYGLEGGVSILSGERLARSGDDPMPEGNDGGFSKPTSTQRVGLDARYRRPVRGGLLAVTSELGGGRDAARPMFMELHQAEYLHRSRRWGTAAQYRRTRQAGRPAESAVIGEITWYLRNDVGNSNLHWIKLSVERRLDTAHGRPDTIVALQYYLYR
jgi:hypothetical protein